MTIPTDIPSSIGPIAAWWAKAKSSTDRTQQAHLLKTACAFLPATSSDMYGFKKSRTHSFCTPLATNASLACIPRAWRPLDIASSSLNKRSSKVTKACMNLSASARPGHTKQCCLLVGCEASIASLHASTPCVFALYLNRCNLQSAGGNA